MATAARSHQNSSSTEHFSKENCAEVTIKDASISESFLARLFRRRRKGGRLLECVRSQSATICEAARLLPLASEARTFEQLSLMQQQCRKLECDLTVVLSSVVFTPLMPEDIRLLGNSLGKTVKAMLDVASVLGELPRPAMRSTSEAAVLCADTLRKTIDLLPVDRRAADHAWLLSAQARKAELYFRDAQSRLIANEKDPIRVVKYHRCYRTIQLLFRCYRKNAETLTYTILKNA